MWNGQFFRMIFSKLCLWQRWNSFCR